MVRLLIALVILVGIGFGIRYYMNQPVSPAPAPSQAAISWTVENKKEEGETYTADMSYPVFSIPAVDAEIQKAISAGLSDIKELPANPPESAAGKHEFSSQVGTVYASSSVVSVELMLWQYTGGAHGLPVTVGVNVNPVSGIVLTLDDALSMIGKTLEEVSRDALAQVRESLGEDVIFPEGTDAKAENYGTFLIDENAVTFVFQVYQVAPYSAGPQKVRFERVK